MKKTITFYDLSNLKYFNDSPQLTEQHKQWIQDYQAQGLGISVISCWEVAKLVEKNRLILISMNLVEKFNLSHFFVTLPA